MDKGGSVFFGLGVDAWNQAYRVNKVTGKSNYNLHGERGTVIKISPDWKKREVICTGMRFPVGMGVALAAEGVNRPLASGAAVHINREK